MHVDAADILEISAHFGTLEDPRSHINRKHLLGDLLVICVSAVLSGCDGPIAIGEWAKAKAAWLREHLELPPGIPSHDTIGRILIALKLADAGMPAAPAARPGRSLHLSSIPRTPRPARPRGLEEAPDDRRRHPPQHVRRAGDLGLIP